MPGLATARRRDHRHRQGIRVRAAQPAGKHRVRPALPGAALVQRRHPRSLPLDARQSVRGPGGGPQHRQPAAITMGQPVHEYGRLHRRASCFSRRPDGGVDQPGKSSALPGPHDSARASATHLSVVLRWSERGGARRKPRYDPLRLGGRLSRTGWHGDPAALPEPERRACRAGCDRSSGCGGDDRLPTLQPRRVLPLSELRLSAAARGWHRQDVKQRRRRSVSHVRAHSTGRGLQLRQLVSKPETRAYVSQRRPAAGVLG